MTPVSSASLHPVWQLPRDVVFFLLVVELLVSAEGRGRPERSIGRARSAVVPSRTHRPARGSLAGRRPRG